MPGQWKLHACPCAAAKPATRLHALFTRLQKHWRRACESLFTRLQKFSPAIPIGGSGRATQKLTRGNVLWWSLASAYITVISCLRLSTLQIFSTHKTPMASTPENIFFIVHYNGKVSRNQFGSFFESEQRKCFNVSIKSNIDHLKKKNRAEATP